MRGVSSAPCRGVGTDNDERLRKKGAKSLSRGPSTSGSGRVWIFYGVVNLEVVEAGELMYQNLREFRLLVVGAPHSDDIRQPRTPVSHREIGRHLASHFIRAVVAAAGDEDSGSVQVVGEAEEIGSSFEDCWV